MTDQSSSLAKTPEWLALQDHAKNPRHIRDLFAENHDRLAWGRVSGAGLTLDLTKNRMTKTTVELLLTLARARQVISWRDKMVAGEVVNLTEGRAALHMALRGGLTRPPTVDGQDAGAAVAEAKARFLSFVDRVHSGDCAAATGKRFVSVVNIGIGGSDLGPRLVCDALRPHWAGNVRPYFVANVDVVELERVFEQVDPETTLFIIASKSFTTQETMRNAQTAKAWLEARLPNPEDAGRHFVAVTSNQSAAQEFGIASGAIFEFWDWVGGRTSVWSSVGLSVALALGEVGFQAFLNGAAEMDRHFQTAPPERNLPLLLALTGIWNHNFLGLASHAVLPYAQSLTLLPDYLQQLDMESNGKSVTPGGKPVGTLTAPIIWGAAGTNGQHAFYQWLHQGTEIASSDIIIPLRADDSEQSHQEHHDILVAHAIAQGEALAFGRNEDVTRADLTAEGLSEGDVARLLPHRIFEGNRPVSTITLDRLTPATLGALLALYEHKVFAQGVVWGVNSFDQWGVELGKSLAGKVLGALVGEAEISGFDPSTSELIKAARNSTVNEA